MSQSEKSRKTATLSSDAIEVSSAELARQAAYMGKIAYLLQERFPNSRSPVAYLHSFGCQQNTADGELLAGMLERMGFMFTGSPQEADLVLFNTCAVRENAEDRVFGNVGALKNIKREHPGMLIVLCGCMVQQEHIAQKLYQSYPYVDLVFGTDALYRFPELLHRVLVSNKRETDIVMGNGRIAEGLPARREDPYKANLSVMYGCNNFCTYCIVPFVRGRERSRSAQAILAEARELISSGRKELLLLGQNVNSYGNDLEDGIRFPALLRQINDIPGDFRIRFMTSHPKDCTRELIDAVAECEKVCRHIHLPVQSGSDRVLAQMNRRYTAAQYLDLIAYAREKDPEIAFTSDIIIGFPGETYEDAQQTIALVEKVRYHALFTFIFSPRKGTKAAQMEDPVSREEKGRWFQELLDVQDRIGREIYEQYVGKTVRVLIDGKGRTGENILTGRTEQNGIVEFSGSPDLIGRFAEISITAARNANLLGDIIQID